VVLAWRAGAAKAALAALAPGWVSAALVAALLAG
jgi:hypothetical protein